MQWLCPARAPQPMLFPPIKAPLCCYNGLLVTTELCPNQVFLIAGPKAHPLKQQPHTLWPVFLVKTLPPKGPAVDLPPPFPLVQCRYPPYCPMKESEENLYATCACHATPDPSPTRLFCGVWFGADEAEDVRLVYKNSYCFYEPFLCPTMSLLQAGVRARMTRGLSSKETMLHVLDSHSCSMPKESDTWLHRLPKRYIIYQVRGPTRPALTPPAPVHSPSRWGVWHDACMKPLSTLCPSAPCPPPPPPRGRGGSPALSFISVLLHQFFSFMVSLLDCSHSASVVDLFSHF